MDYNKTKSEYLSFLGQTCHYDVAKYVIQPVPYDKSSTWKRGAAKAPASILEASMHLEDYDIETDSQAVKAGIKTEEPFFCDGDAPVVVDALKPLAKRFFVEEKIPCFIGGDHSISIGVFQALKDLGKDFSILHFGAHTDLRPSYEGSPYNHACVMRRALEVTDNIVQCGIRSMSNREKTVYNAEKTFFAQDIHQSDLWIDDVIAELGDNVYVTLDVNVFDPSIILSGTPEPGGLYFQQVNSLLKLLAKRKKVVGFDVVEFLPNQNNHAPEYMVAKLIYGFISYLEAYSSS